MQNIRQGEITLKNSYWICLIHAFIVSTITLLMEPLLFKNFHVDQMKVNGFAVNSLY